MYQPRISILEAVRSRGVARPDQVVDHALFIRGLRRERRLHCREQQPLAFAGQILRNANSTERARAASPGVFLGSEFALTCRLREGLLWIKAPCQLPLQSRPIVDVEMIG